MQEGGDGKWLKQRRQHQRRRNKKSGKGRVVGIGIGNNMEEEDKMFEEKDRKLICFMVEGGLLLIGYVKEQSERGILLECPAVVLSGEGNQLILAPFVMTIISSDGDMWLNNDYVMGEVEIDRNSVIGNQYESYVIDIKSGKGRIIVPNKDVLGGNMIDLSKFRRNGEKLN